MSSDDTLSDSPFRDMLGTNLIPSNNQVNQIKVFLEAPLNELAVVEHEVNNARRVLEALVAKQTMLNRHRYSRAHESQPSRIQPQDNHHEFSQPTIHQPANHNAQNRHTRPYHRPHQQAQPYNGPNKGNTHQPYTTNTGVSHNPSLQHATRLALLPWLCGWPALWLQSPKMSSRPPASPHEVAFGGQWSAV